jgi:5'-3' exonuclease
MFFHANGLDIQQLESFGTEIVGMQKGIMWWLGDCASYAARRFPDTWEQCFPVGVSPGLIARAKGVAEAYPSENDRNPLATWTIHAQNAGKSDRIERVQAHVDAGRTSDEARKADANERKDTDRPRWLLAVDVNYHLHRMWHSGAGVEAAMQVAGWVERTAKRLQEKGLTDVACCFDSNRNFRKDLTADWEDKYKPRPPKDPELVQQLTLVYELLEGRGFCCAVRHGFEADDVMASAASQFGGRVTLLTQDKDLRQCLSDRCNILLDVEWTNDETSGEMLPEYKWLSAKQHTEETAIRPDQWTEYQTLCGDSVDGIKGAAGIGTKGAADLIQEFGTAAGAIQAANDGDERIKPRKREALIAFEELADVTRQLVTLRTDLELPTATRIQS